MRPPTKYITVFKSRLQVRYRKVSGFRCQVSEKYRNGADHRAAQLSQTFGFTRQGRPPCRPHWQLPPRFAKRFSKGRCLHPDIRRGLCAGLRMAATEGRPTLIFEILCSAVQSRFKTEADRDPAARGAVPPGQRRQTSVYSFCGRQTRNETGGRQCDPVLPARCKPFRRAFLRCLP